jgi:pyruvate,water dikinase
VVARSGQTEQARDYARHVGIEPGTIRVAAIVQEMVPAVASGVAFSRDPITGSDHVVVEAVAGGGESLVGRGADPQRWVQGHEELQRPEDPLLPAAACDQLVDVVRGIERASGQPVDVEWVWDGAGLHLVQWRPITGLARAPRIWSSRMARDMLPGVIPPLVWSVNVPVLSGVWAGLVHEALGDVGLDPDDLVRSFGYRAYFNVGALGGVFTSLGMPADALELMRAGTSHSAVRPPVSMLVRRTPRLARFAVILGTWEGRVARERAELDRVWALERDADVSALADDELLARVQVLRQLLARAARLNVVTPLLADAWAGSVRRAAQARGLDPGAMDPGQELPAVRSLDPAHALSGMSVDDQAAWQRFLERFGHLSDSPNDCSLPTWSEQPEAVRRLLDRGEVEGGRGPVARGRAVAGSREVFLSDASGLTRGRLARRWDRAARYRQAREEVGYTYARTYALFRPTFLEAGRRLADRGVIADPSDVFLLDLEELAESLHGRLAADPLVVVRREEMSEAADLHWPETIIGDEPVPIRGRSRARILTGVPTSRGRHTGPARVITSLATAPDIGPEDVLILAAADVTWTPLLLRAGAVVTETGGMLSHASIIAREFGLPCVASVEGATGIAEGTTVCVDGGSGEVLLLGADDG